MSKKLIASLILVATAVVYVCIPHRTKVLEAHSNLQSGNTMGVKLTLQSAWGWGEPDRIAALQVELDGRDLPVRKEGYSRLEPIDTKRIPVIAETRGFPEIIVWGLKGSSLSEVRWRFLNYYFSEREIVRDHKVEVTQYTIPTNKSNASVDSLSLPDSQTHFVSKVGAPVRMNEGRVQTITINADQIKTATGQETKQEIKE